MGSRIRECVKKISGGEDVESYLRAYVQESIGIHDRHARLKLMMEYFVFYEIVEEGTNPYLDMAQDTIGALNDVIHAFFQEGNETGTERFKKLEEQAGKLREEVTERMQVLTSYIDRFVIYEYILNRLQYRFEDRENELEDQAFIQETLQFIFATKDNMVINENIRMVLGQLPMRVTRKRYFDLIRESLSVYKDGDLDALNGFLYMFRTSAMLYRTPDMEQYFTEFIPVLKEFEEMDWEATTAESYQIFAEKLQISSSKLHELSDIYVLLQNLINEIYAVILAKEHGAGGRDFQTADIVIRGINELFMGEDDRETLEEKETKIHALAEYFPKIEGEQEKCLEQMNMADAALEEIAKGRQEEIESLGLVEAFVALDSLMKLSSGSAFVELGTDKVQETVTTERLKEAEQALIGELKEFLKGKSRILRRAVMANTLDKLPVFFGTPQEVADYVSMSLSLCDDESEKYASKQLVLECMNE